MALAKARHITVAGRKYQWKVSTNGRLHLAVFDSQNNRKLIIYYEHGKKITPWLIKSLIQKAETEGWRGQIKWER